MADITRTLVARRTSTCSVCRERIEPGEKIARKERKGGGWAGRWNHARCEVTWLRSGRTCPTTGAFEFVGIAADGTNVGSNLPGIRAAVAEYAPTRPDDLPF